MDELRFDALIRGFTHVASRRRHVGLLLAIPALSGLLPRLESPSSLARDRRRRRKKRHGSRQRRNESHRQRRQACKPRSRARVCTGTCGPVKSQHTCGKTFDCGACDCVARCAVCHVCQPGTSTPGTCILDVAMVGESCSGSGQICQANGICSCNETSCPDSAPICTDGSCVGCSADSPCPSGKCCRQDGTCAVACPNCQTCDDGMCQPDFSLEHTCDGPCADGQWCNSGSCASIVETVRLPDCQSLCGASTMVCGHEVTCPACYLCIDQTGCGGTNTLQDGPVGPGQYCGFSDGFLPCATTADCADDAPFMYCTNNVSDYQFCARLCPY